MYDTLRKEIENMPPAAPTSNVSKGFNIENFIENINREDFQEIVNDDELGNITTRLSKKYRTDPNLFSKLLTKMATLVREADEVRKFREEREGNRKKEEDERKANVEKKKENSKALLQLSLLSAKEKLPARNVHNILGAVWQSKLRLEALEDLEPPTKRPRALMSVSSSLEFVAQGPAQPTESEMPLERPAVTWAEPVEWPALTPLPAGLTEDIGTFETYEPKPFAAPKPGLKSKRSSGRGRGVMGAVLAADGSVTHEQSRML